MTHPHVIFVDDEAPLRHAATQTFDLADLVCKTFDDGEAALADLSRGFSGVVVTDIRMPNIEGTEVMKRALEIDPELPVIMITGHGDIDLAVKCIKHGAYDFIEKPFDPHRLVDCVRRALDKRQLVLENRELRSATTGDDSVTGRLTGRSAAISAVRTQLQTIAKTDADVLIFGETGTGKELAARAIHEASERAQGPFVHLNCAALPEAMIESELFGHVAGAFAGAMKDRFGKFEHANRGILCLDEIDSLPLALQAKLLQALQSKAITRLGSNDAVPLDFRTIAIAKSDLTGAVTEGAFRADLLYRLNVVSLRLPTLDERRDDIPFLIEALLADAHVRYNRTLPDVPHALVQALSGRDWTGNVRELRNAVERIYLGLEDMTGIAAATGPVSLADQVAEIEKALIVGALKAENGSVKAVCDALLVPRKTLYDKMRKYGIERV